MGRRLLRTKEGFISLLLSNKKSKKGQYHEKYI